MMNKETMTRDMVVKHQDFAQVFIRFDLPCIVCGGSLCGAIESLAKKQISDMQKFVNKLH